MGKARTFMAVLPMLLAVPSMAYARQSAPATVALDVAVRPTVLSGGTAAFVGGTALLGTGARLLFGGGGWVQLGEADVETGGADAGFRLRVSYGGLVLAWPLAELEQGRLSARVLLGAGNAKVYLRAGGIASETGADNFGVIEPEVAFDTPLTWRLRGTAGLSYRAVFGLEDLTGVTSGSVRGISLRLGLAFSAG